MASYFDDHGVNELSENLTPDELPLVMARILLRFGFADDIWLTTMGSDGLGPYPTAKKVIEELPTQIITKEEAEKKNTCSVCLGHLEEDNEVKTLLCKHQFHTKCILPWLEKVNTCPVCREEFPTDDPAYEEFRKYKARKKQRDFELDNLHNSMFG